MLPITGNYIFHIHIHFVPTEMALSPLLHTYLCTKVHSIRVEVEQLIGRWCTALSLELVVDGDMSRSVESLNGDTVPEAIVDQHSTDPSQTLPRAQVVAVLHHPMNNLQEKGLEKSSTHK